MRSTVGVIIRSERYIGGPAVFALEDMRIGWWAAAPAFTNLLTNSRGVRGTGARAIAYAQEASSRKHRDELRAA